MIENRAPETLYLVIPCYNEEEVLPETSRRLLEKLAGMVAAGKKPHPLCGRRQQG